LELSAKSGTTTDGRGDAPDEGAGETTGEVVDFFGEVVDLFAGPEGNNVGDAVGVVVHALPFPFDFEPLLPLPLLPCFELLHPFAPLPLLFFAPLPPLPFPSDKVAAEVAATVGAAVAATVGAEVAATVAATVGDKLGTIDSPIPSGSVAPGAFVLSAGALVDGL
jgi:hypothetical protein